MIFSHDPWVWVAAILTLAIFSFLYKENPFYRFAEHLFVGISAGYGVAIYWNNAIMPNLVLPVLQQHQYWFIIPGLLGALFFMRFSAKLNWLILIPMAFLLGVGNGMALAPTIQTEIIKQMQSAIGDATTMAGGHWGLVWGVLSFLGVLATLSFFFFSREQKGALKVSANIGIWFIMIGFGASFGNTVMGRISLLIGRVQFLLTDWIHVIK
ncbi:MAG TPA: hypothetical protein VMF29_01530 [Candidatus Edwardsbacteria bacterium]|nr:hypothetical protein [Candidatus Edwardsbacteria bacterium]